MERVDDLNQEAIKFNRFQLAVARQAQDKNRYLTKRVRIFICSSINPLRICSISFYFRLKKTLLVLKRKNFRFLKKTSINYSSQYPCLHVLLRCSWPVKLKLTESIYQNSVLNLWRNYSSCKLQRVKYYPCIILVLIWQRNKYFYYPHELVLYKRCVIVQKNT